MLQSRIDEAVQAECDRHRAGQPDWAPLATPRPHSAAGRASIRDQLLALLKAFCDAARPSGGLPLTALNQPADVPALRAAGAANARQGECLPKVLDKVRAGKPVDLRIAVAVMHFLRLVLDTPALTFHHIGAIESHRQRTVRRLAHALHVAGHELPASVYDALLRRAEETAGYAHLFTDVRVHYGGLRLETDALGLRRMVLTRTTCYRPVRLLGFADRLSPHKAYEWYEAGHIRRVRLRLQPAQPGSPPVELPTTRRLLDAQGIVRIDVADNADPALLRHLAIPAAGVAESALQIWEEEMVFNPADRDILVWYSPVQGLEVEFEAAFAERVDVRVGDSPGLHRTASGWRLDRTLMPREVIAVRLRLRELSSAWAARLGSRGECRADMVPLSP